jgi:hypothetical protein
MDVKRLSDRVMRGVVATGVMNDASEDRVTRAIEIMRAELGAFFLDARYADARDCVLRRSIGDGYVIGLIVAECVSRIRSAS